MFNSIEDRALSEHRGSALFAKLPGATKYSLFLPVTSSGAVGGTPNQLDKTVIGNKQATSVEGRQENSQKSIPFYAHRDNINILEAVKGKNIDFLRILPDFTGYKYSGNVSYSLESTGVGSLEQGTMTITPTSSDTYVEDVYSIVEDTAMITSAIDEVVEIASTGTYVLDMVTNPTDATLSVLSGTTSVATAAFGTSANAKKLTITGVAAGSSIVKVTVAKTGYASFVRTILVIVK